MGGCPPDPVPALSELESNQEEVSGDQKPAGGFSSARTFRDWQFYGGADIRARRGFLPGTFASTPQRNRIFSSGSGRHCFFSPEVPLISYQDLAVRLGHPTACRAVAGAVAANPISYLIPCHRVIRKSGEIHNYRWGHIRKKAMLGRESSRP
ncbi:MAG: MGMT family protein [Proteobacteria bacterium]|nr:MGMT family protein [Pseudomonadota bacterium]MBU1648497.1 MGMT family protein [Pseudomonadota bacterium]MBU1986331.1 MGMT family protein [Pseudomonadota bacterium]